MNVCPQRDSNSIVEVMDTVEGARAIRTCRWTRRQRVPKEQPQLQKYGCFTKDTAVLAFDTNAVCFLQSAPAGKSPRHAICDLGGRKFHLNVRTGFRSRAQTSASWNNECEKHRNCATAELHPLLDPDLGYSTDVFTSSFTTSYAQAGVFYVRDVVDSVADSGSMSGLIATCRVSSSLSSSHEMLPAPLLNVASRLHPDAVKKARLRVCSLSNCHVCKTCQLSCSSSRAQDMCELSWNPCQLPSKHGCLHDSAHGRHVLLRAVAGILRQIGVSQHGLWIHSSSTVAPCCQSRSSTCALGPSGGFDLPPRPGIRTTHPRCARSRLTRPSSSGFDKKFC